MNQTEYLAERAALEARVFKDINRCPFGTHNGIFARKVENGKTLLYVKLTEASMSPYGIPHGGLIYTLCDAAAGNASFLEQNGKCYTVTTTGKVSFLNYDPEAKELAAEAYVEGHYEGLSICRVKVHSNNGILVAVGRYVMFHSPLREENNG